MDYKCSIKGCKELAAVTFNNVVVTISQNNRTRNYTRVIHICLNHLTAAVGGGRSDRP